MRKPLIWLGFAAALGLVSCLEPLVSDEVPPGAAVFESDEAVPSISENPELMAQLEAELELPPQIPRLSGFAAGEPVHYWDFGPAPATALPIWVIVRPDPEGPFDTPKGRFAPTGHPNIIDAIPGDPGYSPFWRVQLVPVTERYQDQLLTSLEAISQAIQLGIAEPAVPIPAVVNCPVVLPGSLLDQGPGSEPSPAVSGYYRGHVVYYHTLGQVPSMEDSSIVVQELYVLRREGGEPLSEMKRGVDMTGDGDIHDSNNIFERGPAAENATALVREVEVVVDAGLELVDTSGDEQVSSLMGRDALFDATQPISGTVVAIYPRESGLLFNRPAQDEGP